MEEAEHLSPLCLKNTVYTYLVVLLKNVLKTDLNNICFISAVAGLKLLGGPTTSAKVTKF